MARNNNNIMHIMKNGPEMIEKNSRSHHNCAMVCCMHSGNLEVRYGLGMNELIEVQWYNIYNEDDTHMANGLAMLKFHLFFSSHLVRWLIYQQVCLFHSITGAVQSFSGQMFDHYICCVVIFNNGIGVIE